MGQREHLTTQPYVCDFWLVEERQKSEVSRAELDQIICWLTGYTKAGLEKKIEQEADFETFFAQAPVINPNVSLTREWFAVYGWRTWNIR